MSIRCLLSLGVLCGLALAARAQTARNGSDISGPTKFYAVSSTFWDNGPAWDYHILEAKQDGTDTLVRDIMIKSAQLPCGPSCTVKAKIRRLQNTSPAELVGDNNPCAVDQAELRRDLRRAKRALKHTLLFSSAEFGIVATCGSKETVLHLPLLPFPLAARGSPRILRSYDLLSDLETRVFGTSPVFQSAGETKVFEDVPAGKTDDEETAGEELVPELRSGVFDRALWDDCQKPLCAGEGLNHVLEIYIPPEHRTEPIVSWVNRPSYGLLKCELPPYPPLARMARVEGDVELEIQVDERTGLVVGVTAMAGHPLLQAAAVQAVKQWCFRPEKRPEGVTGTLVKLRFSMNCSGTAFPTEAR